ncbi:MAG: hypothetical protein AABZ14_06295 [Candidatus Margulisiibacteriota bacterium]|mgnify:CR=1 FL=1
MRSKLIIFVGFIVFLFVVVSQIRFTRSPSTPQKQADFILENSYTRHFIKGQSQFSLEARRIEIFENSFHISGAVIRFRGGVELYADEVQFDMRKATLLAQKHVVIQHENWKYTGEEVSYFLNEKRFSGYNGGRLVLSK